MAVRTFGTEGFADGFFGCPAGVGRTRPLRVSAMGQNVVTETHDVVSAAVGLCASKLSQCGLRRAWSGRQR